MLVNVANLRTLYTGYSAAFAGGVAAAGAPLYTRVATVVPSATRSNEYGWLGQMPRIREWIGDRVVQNLDTKGYTIKNRSFESTIAVSRDDIEDDNIGIYTPMFTEFGRSSATFPDELTWGLFSAGFNTPCFDGQYFFDTDHPVLDADGNPYSVSNFGGGSGIPWFLVDDSRAIKPIIFQNRRPFELTRMDALTDEVVFNSKQFRYGTDGRCNVGFGFWQLAHGSRQPLNAASYEAARVQLASQKADYGRPLGVQGRLLIVPPALEGAARKLLNSEYAAGGETNQWKGTAELLVVPWLA